MNDSCIKTIVETDVELFLDDKKTKKIVNDTSYVQPVTRSIVCRVNALVIMTSLEGRKGKFLLVRWPLKSQHFFLFLLSMNQVILTSPVLSDKQKCKQSFQAKCLSRRRNNSAPRLLLFLTDKILLHN